MASLPARSTLPPRSTTGIVVLCLSIAMALTACGRLGESEGAAAGGGSDGQGVPGSTGDPSMDPTGPQKDCPERAAPGASDSPVGYSCDEDFPIPKGEPVTPVPGMADVHPVPWDRIDVADDDRTLTIHFTSGVQPCNVLDHVDVSYGNDAVTITLHEGHQPGSEDLACPEIAVFKSMTFVLEEALEGRELLDGAPQS